jgi:hypothetical protein
MIVSKYISIMEDKYNDQGNSSQFVEKLGPRHFLPDSAKPIEYFNPFSFFFFTNSLWTKMVKETNRYVEELLSTSIVNDKSRKVNWYPLTILEMKAFVAVLLEMEVTKKPTIYSYWAENSRAVAWFPKSCRCSQGTDPKIF